MSLFFQLRLILEKPDLTLCLFPGCRKSTHRQIDIFVCRPPHIAHRTRQTWPPAGWTVSACYLPALVSWPIVTWTAFQRLTVGFSGNLVTIALSQTTGEKPFVLLWQLSFQVTLNNVNRHIYSLPKIYPRCEPYIFNVMELDVSEIFWNNLISWGRSMTREESDSKKKVEVPWVPDTFHRAGIDIRNPTQEERDKYKKEKRLCPKTWR